ncbi:MAG: hypothetical protein ACTHLO_07620 [Pseudolabrys sp.]
MPAGTNDPRLEKVTRKWLDLAERRLASYEDLYRSGRWRHYYPTEALFAVRMLDVIKVVKTLRRVTERIPEHPRVSRLRQAA